MNDRLKIHEKFLSEIWKSQNFIKMLSTKDGQPIEIVNTGAENKDAGGPDFKGAKIKIGNITYSGDVEIDYDYQDWKNHGHDINNKYNSVILHAVFSDNSNRGYVITSNGRKVQSISLSSFLKDDIAENIQDAIVKERENRINKMRCVEVNYEINEDEKLNFVYDLGIKRFCKKRDKLFERLKEIVFLQEMNLREPVIKYELNEKFYNRSFTQKDFCQKPVWHQLLYESIFEALGYAKNKQSMKNLAVAADIKFLSSFKNNNNIILILESILYNVSGLIPDIDSIKDEKCIGYVKKLEEIWNGIKSRYDGKILRSTQWHFFRIRPQNFPTVRIAGGARLVNRLINGNLIDKILEAVEQISSFTKLEQTLRSLLITKGEGFWATHYVFTEETDQPINYFIGASRADEILVNIIMPVVALYFDVFDKKELSKKTLKLYLEFSQDSENNLVNEVCDTLYLKDAWKRSVLYQGMIELFRDYCSKEKCLECIIGKKIFN